MKKSKKIEIEINPFKSREQKVVMMRVKKDLYDTYEKLAKRYDVPVSTLMRSHLEQISESDSFKKAIGKTA